MPCRLAIPLRTGLAVLVTACGCVSSLPRVDVPSESCVLRLREQDGRSEYEPYALSPAERDLVSQCLTSLPPAHRRWLAQFIDQIGFVYFLDGEGRFWSAAGRRSLLFSPELLWTAASDWLSLRATRCFAPGDPWIEITIDCGNTGAFEYALLHQTTRLADEKMTAAAGRGRNNDRRPAGIEKLAVAPGQPPPETPIDEAPKVYRALSGSPFVSLRATADAQSDLAELFAFYHLTQKLGRPYRLTIRRDFPSEPRVLFEYEPLKTPAVLERLDALEMFYREEGP